MAPRERYENDGDGDFGAPQPAVTVGTVANVRSLALADLNGDGDLDIAFAAVGRSTVGVLDNQPDGPDPDFVDLNFAAIPFAAPFWIEAGDVDSDGRIDLVASSVGNGRVAWFRNLGNAAVTGEPPTFGIGANQTGGLVGATAVELADFDADGDLDFAVATRNLDRVQWMENPGLTGAGDFLRRPLPPVQDGALALAAGDLNGDGRIDLAVGNEIAGGTAWMPNLAALHWDDLERGDLAAWSSTTP